MKETYYIGLDVHKDTVAIASIKSGSRSEAIYHSTCGGSNAAVERALRKLAKQLGVKLFTRANNSLQLTVAGGRLLKAVTEGFNQILDGAQHLDLDNLSCTKSICSNV